MKKTMVAAGVFFLFNLFSAMAVADPISFAFKGGDFDKVNGDHTAMMTTHKTEYCKKQCASTKGMHCIQCCTRHWGEEGTTYETAGKAGTCKGAKDAKN